MGRIVVKRAIGGQGAPKQNWPWIALLAYDLFVKEFLCSGTVITRRHVLTAAQCIRRNLVSVRLGEHDINNQTESEHVDINIKKAVKHPSFRRRRSAGRNGIGVLYLEEEIQYNEYIKPICLPISTLRNDNLVGFQPFFAGWGTTDPDKVELSPILQQLQITIYENKICDTFFKHLHILPEEDNIDEAFICAGYLASGNGPCAGDAEAPLVVAHHIPGEGYRLILIGVVSAGIECGLKDGPSLFTRISYYMDWIQEQCSKEV